MSICNRGDGDFNEQACLAAGGAPYGDAGSTGRDQQPFEFPPKSGRWYMISGETGKMVPVDAGPAVDMTPIHEALRTIGAISFGDPARAGPENRARGIWPQGPDPEVQWNAAAASDPNELFQLPNGRLYSTNDAMASLLKLSGMDGADGGSGVGWANLAQRQQEFAYEQEQDRVQLAINVLTALGAQARNFDTQQQNTRTNQLSALPYMVDPGQEFFSDFSPTSYGARMGLIEPQRIQHMPFTSALPANPYVGQVDSGLAALQQLAMR